MAGDAITILNEATVRPPVPLSQDEVMTLGRRGSPEFLRLVDRMTSNAPQVPEARFRLVIDAFEKAGPEARQRMTDRLSRDSRNALMGYASGLAVLAVRRDSADLIRLGLLALAVEGGREDTRDSIHCLAKLYHSAMKLGIDVDALFNEVAALTAGKGLSTAMAGFPSRPPEVRDLRAFLLREVMTEEGFVYEQVWPIPGER